MQKLRTLCLFSSTLVMLAGCSSTAMTAKNIAERPDESLVNTYWKLLKVNGQPAATHPSFREAHLVLHQEGSRLAGATGCNTLTGGYYTDNERITFKQIAATKVACPASQAATEQAFLTALGQVQQWRVKGSELVLTSTHNQALARFEAVHLY